MIRLSQSAIFACFLFGAASVAHAHQSSVASLRVDIEAATGNVEATLSLAATDLFEALGLDKDRPATAEEIKAGSKKLYAYVSPLVRVTSPANCSSGGESVSPREASGELFADIKWTWSCGAITSLDLTYDLFFDLDPTHNAALEVRADDKTSRDFFSADHRVFTWSQGETLSGFVAFLKSGAEHILIGADHILFLLSLLLMVAITRSGVGDFERRDLKAGLIYTVQIVTAFTVAHSLTLISAALGWLPIHPRLVESIIAMSIVYVAVENIVRPDPPRRYIVTFVFGLLHGMGFASMLQDLLPSDGIVVPVIAFNVGVELGQLIVVGILWPLLFVLARATGPHRYRRWVLPIGGVVLAGLGGVWFIERAFEVTILGL
jgi:hypothetical protein